MMRPLYIDGSVGCRVVLDDPALRVTVSDRADQLFPIARVSRVVCKGVVEWSMSALLACADAGVMVLFLEKNGELRAKWLGRNGERQIPAQRLVDLLARGDGPGLFENWRLAMEKIAARSFARRIGLPDWREAPVTNLRRQVYTCLNGERSQSAKLLEGILHGEVLAWLVDAGFTGEDEALLHGETDLAAFLVRLLMWDFYPFLLDEAGCREASLRGMAALFQQRTDRCHRLFRSILNKLHQFLLAVS